jgi:hypothetical protein
VVEYTSARDKLVSDGIIVIHECGARFMWKGWPPEVDLPIGK